jgi:hypothetical protein
MAKLTDQDLIDAVEDLGMIAFFPQESKGAVMRELRKMCPNRESLLWTVSTVVAKCDKWPGIAEIRGLLCTRYDAADGIDQPYCTIPGFTPGEQEAKYLERHEEVKRLSAGEDRAAIASLMRSLPAPRKIQ